MFGLGSLVTKTNDFLTRQEGSLSGQNRRLNMSAKQITCIIIAMLAAILANAESKIDPDVLKSYAVAYKGKNVERAEVEFRFLFKDGELFGHYVERRSPGRWSPSINPPSTPSRLQTK
jgi:hypothetical protein